VLSGRPNTRWTRPWVFALSATAVAGALAWAYLEWDQHWIRQELERARADVALRAWTKALQRLETLARWKLGRSAGLVDYQLGLCYWNLGRRPEAIVAFARVPAGSPFEVSARAFQAEEHLRNFEFRAAEDQLLAILRPEHPDFPHVMQVLVRLGRMEARYDEVRSWMRMGFDRSDDPIGVLRQLWLVDRGGVPLKGLRENLEQALKRSSDDDRVWLGLGRVATLEARFDQAEAWLARCARLRPYDQAVVRARLELARAAQRPDEAVEILAGPSGAALDPEERLAARAWIYAALGSTEDERRAVERWLDREPHNPLALERLATLTALTGDRARAADLRRRKARVDDALDRYRRRIESDERFTTPADRLATAGYAEEAGRLFDARAWYTLVRRLEPSSAQAEAGLARIDRAMARARDPAALERIDTIASAASAPVRQGGGRSARIDFRDEAARAELAFRFENGCTAILQLPALMSGGVGLLDFDRDGWLDVFCLQGGAFPPEIPLSHSASGHGQDARASGGDRLYRNRRDGTFEDVTTRSGIAGFPRGYGHAVAVGDYDNDGWPDLFLTRWRAYALYRNRGDGTFLDVTCDAGLGGDRDWPTSAAFADLDGDGDLDLYVCHYLRWDAESPRVCSGPQGGAYTFCRPVDFPALPDHVFRNDGGRFVDVTAQSGIADPEGRGLGVVAADLDGDGKVDLFVANDQTANLLFRNLGGFRFEEVGQVAGVAGNAAGGYQAGMGVACGDVDGDGRPDLAVTNFYGEGTTLYQNLGRGLFTDSASAFGLTVPTRQVLGFGAAFFDADNDGHVDLLTANGHLTQLPGIPYAMPTQLFLGDGRRFWDGTEAGGEGLAAKRVGRGLAVGDLDNDGRLDAVVVDQQGPLAYLWNRSDAGHFLVVGLEGVQSARDGVAAQVAVTALGRRQYSWRVGGGSYQSASDPRLHFGVGSALGVEELEVIWPSGLVQRFKNLSVDRGYRIREGDASPSPLPGFRH
jgi:tetratricopeptide (TPR) repeat protein